MGVGLRRLRSRIFRVVGLEWVIVVFEMVVWCIDSYMSTESRILMT